MIKSGRADQAPYALAHDYFTQRGGAERVAIALADCLSVDTISAALSEPRNTFQDIRRFRLANSFLNAVPAFRRDPRRAFPLLPLAWLLRRPEQARVVVASSSGWAHAVRIKKNAKKVVYCHNPPRWLWQADDYLNGQPKTVRLLLAVMRPILVALDKRAAASADLYLANSTSVAKRIKHSYGIDAEVLHPPVAIETNQPLEPLPDMPDAFFITVARGRGYKGTQNLVNAFREMPERNLVIAGSASASNDLPENVISVGRVSDAQLRWLYAKAEALVSVSHEDFGLTPIEANAMGTPVLVLAAGGFLDSTHEGVSGSFIERESPGAIIEAVQSFKSSWDREQIVAHADAFSTIAFNNRLKAILEHL